MTAIDRRYQLGLLALCALCALLFAVDLFSGTITASEGLDFRVNASGTPFVGQIAGVARSSPAEAAGLQNGDLVPFAHLEPVARYRALSGVYGHETFQLVIERNGKLRNVAYTSGPAVPQTRWDLLLGSAANVWMFLFAALLAWRCPGSREARALSAFLSLNQLAGFMGPGDFVSPYFAFDISIAALAYVAQGAAVALLVYYASLFARPLSFVRQTLAFASYAVTALAVAGACWVLFGVIFGVAEPFDAYYPERLLLGASWVSGLAALFVALSASGGSERGRLAWTTLSLAPLVLAQALFTYSYVILTQTYGYSIFGQLLNVCSFVAPLGMTYALFNRRLLDLGFAFNRAAVYTGVSVVVVGSFMLIEFILSEFLGSGRNANVMAGAVLALVLGFSMRPIHKRVDHVLDNVFFRKRHEDEHAIRNFAQQVPHITDADTIVARTRRTLEEHADASSASVYVADRAGNYGAAQENDPAIVSMRTFNARVDLHGLDSSLNGEFAYPMMARGRLVGVLVLGQKRNQEPYAPDESDAIAYLAHNAGFALDALLLRSTERNEVLEAIRESNERVLHAIGEIARNH